MKTCFVLAVILAAAGCYLISIDNPIGLGLVYVGVVLGVVASWAGSADDGPTDDDLGEV